MYSIIIPVYNNLVALDKTLSALYAQEQFVGQEVILVDNGSTEPIAGILEKYPDLVLLHEKKFLGSPYSCRNRGIEKASGEILVFLDATCTPAPGWFTSLEAAFRDQEIDMVAANVSFEIGDDSSPGEMVDAIRNVQNYRMVEKGYATTACLAVRRALIDSQGMFAEGIRSGGDMQWTKRATLSGHRLVFSPETTVIKEARGRTDLLKKARRVGGGMLDIWLATNAPVMLQTAKVLVTAALPPNFKMIHEGLRTLRLKPGLKQLMAIYWIWWLVSCHKCMGLLGRMLNGAPANSVSQPLSVS